MAAKCVLRIIEKNRLGFELLKPSKISNLFNKDIKIAATLFSTGHVPPYNAKQTDDEIFKRSIEVYSGSLSGRVKRIKIFSLLTSGLGLILQPVLIEKWSTQTPNIPIAVTIFFFLGFHTYATPILLHLITKKYVVSLNYNEDADMYIAKTYTLFLKNKLVFFKLEDVEVPAVPGMFSSFLVKGEPFFMQMEDFKDVEHYRKIMGYDKPIDLKLHTTTESVKQPTDGK